MVRGLSHFTVLCITMMVSWSALAQSGSDDFFNLQDVPGLARIKGQTDFLTYSYERGLRVAAAGLESAGGEESGGGGAAQRAQQESDIFKIGARGSKLLYLLNNYRGLQIISFKKNIAAPEVIGRVVATGNYPRDMYLDEKNKRIIVLEQDWRNTELNGYRLQSRILVYDISKPKAPKLDHFLEFEGTVADSRLVGDVLYVTGTKYDSYRRARSDAKGFVASFNISTPQISKVSAYDLSLPSIYAENLGIHETQTEDGYKYYLTAIASENRWGGSRSNSVVELVDISDPAGEIKPVMMVSAKGGVANRTWMHVKDNALIVTSNYQIPGENAWSGIERIAVQSFGFPTEQDERITEKEAQRRELNIEHAVQGLSAEDHDQKLAALMADSKEGLIGRFVKVQSQNNSTFRLKKIAADSTITVGDDKGQSARLQDVRFVGGKLYLFWVPQNQIDPFDLFDISDLKAGIKYEGRLHFDGWIAKSKPVTFKGRHFVIGIGWIVDAVNNENNRQSPQVRLFEVFPNKKAGKKHVEIADLTLKRGIWSNFSGPDKMIEFNIGPDGKGSILFSAYQWSSEKTLSGGKLIGVDLTQTDSGEVFKEGGMLSGDSSWLRRVFSNPELNRIHTFTDTTLGTFNVKSESVIGSPQAVVEATGLLELARNIVGYEQFKTSAGTLNVQVIATGPTTALRVFANNAFADLPLSESTARLELNSQYMSHAVVGNSLLLLTRAGQKHGNGQSTTTYEFRRAEISQDMITVTHQHVWDEVQNWRDHSAAHTTVHGDNYLTVLASNSFVVSTANGLRHLELAPGKKTDTMLPIAVSPVTLSPALPQEANTVNVVRLNGNLYVSYSVPYNSKRFSRNFIAPVSQTSEGKWELASPINIPGTAFALFGDNLVTIDQRLTDTPDKACGEYADVVCEPILTSLHITDGKAVLADKLPYEDAAKLRIGSSELLTIENARGEDRRYSMEPSKFEAISLKNLNFERNRKLIRGLRLEGDVSLAFASPLENGSHLGVITDGGHAQVITWSESSPPTVIPVRLIDERFKESAADTVFAMPPGFSAWSYHSNSQTIQLSGGKRLQILAGLSGICEVLF